MKRIFLILTVVALLAYAVWALAEDHDAEPAPPPGQIPTAAATSSTTAALPTHTTPAMTSPYITPTPGQVMDADHGASSAIPQHTPTRTAAAPSANPSQAAAIKTATPSSKLPRTLTPDQPDWTKPDAVALWFAQRYYTLDTAIDSSPAMGPARAAQAATPQLGQTLRLTPDNGKPGAQWSELVERDGWVKATASMVTMADAPADNDRVAYRSVQVIEDRHSGTSFGTSTHLVALRLERVSGQWRVAHVAEVA